jgi:membrane-associated phospholipid phosphatase
VRRVIWGPPTIGGVGFRDWLDDVERADAAAYAAVARLDVPPLDRAMARLTTAANWSRLWIASGALLGVVGGERGRRATLEGFAAVAATSVVVNVAMKPVYRRPRPERDVLLPRHVPMPLSLSFPSGHAASGFAFAVGVGRLEPRAGAALTVLAAAVAYTRVHTGVHFPGDVVAGSVVGAAVAGVLRRAKARIWV